MRSQNGQLGAAAGVVDASPRGDPAGFVRVLDDATVAIPDRPGNRRCDTLQNILERPGIGLIFLVPGRAGTLRICGRAVVVRDLGMRESLALDGRLPELVIVVAHRAGVFSLREMHSSLQVVGNRRPSWIRRASQSCGQLNCAPTFLR